MSVTEIIILIYYIIPYPVWIIILAGIVGYLILEIREKNDKNGEKIES